jgi:hypothetical protein
MVEKERVYSGHGKGQREHAGDTSLGSNLRRYVTFYFTNFPAQLSNFYLRKGFEVCGMLEDVYVANKRNRNGEPYGFARFSNVKDIAKLTKALNAVWFGHFRVRASVAKFARNATGEERRPEDMQAGLSKGGEVSLKKDGNRAPTRQAAIKDEEAGPKPSTIKIGGAGVPDSKGEEPGVQVGDIVISLGDRQKRVAGPKHGAGQVSKEPDMAADAVKEKENRIFLRNYRPKCDDVQWAQNGLVATVINGEAIPVVQHRIIDCGFL